LNGSAGQEGFSIAKVEIGRTPLRARYAVARKWFLKGGASIADEGLLAGANFVLGVLLGRWLEPVQYGAFALAQSVFLLLGTFHTSVLTEPMLVFGASKYAARFKKYIGVLTIGHLWIVLPAGLLLLGASVLVGRFYSHEAQRALSALALSGPVILLLWLLRRAFYVILKPEWALLGSGLYAVVLLGSAFGLRSADRLSPATAFLAMGLSAVLVCLLLLSRLRPQFRAADDPSASAVASEHWRYARWAVGSAALTWIPSNIYFAVLPVWIGLEGTAALRALNNLIMPAAHTISALTVLLMPLLARRRQEGQRQMLGSMRIFLALLLAGTGIYCLGLSLLRREIILLFYGGKYEDCLPLVPFIGLLPILSGIISVQGAALRVQERPDKVFWSYLVSSSVAVGGGIPLARYFGVAGALGGLLLSSLATAVVMFLLRSGRQPKQ
jgi:O-antigen/teichoic acid export membrane protein